MREGNDSSPYEEKIQCGKLNSYFFQLHSCEISVESSLHYIGNIGNNDA